MTTTTCPRNGFHAPFHQAFCLGVRQYITVAATLQVLEPASHAVAHSLLGNVTIMLFATGLECFASAHVVPLCIVHHLTDAPPTIRFGSGSCLEGGLGQGALGGLLRG